MDERLRELERRASTGDPEAAEALYWTRLRVIGSGLLDQILEAVIHLQRDEPGQVTFFDKLAWLDSGTVPRDLTTQELRDLVHRWSAVDRASEIYGMPNEVRRDGFCCYARDDRTVYRLNGGVSNSNWDTACMLSGEPEHRPFFVVRTQTERNEIPREFLANGGTCVVRATGIVYRYGGPTRGLGRGRMTYDDEWTSRSMDDLATRSVPSLR